VIHFIIITSAAYARAPYSVLSERGKKINKQIFRWPKNISEGSFSKEKRRYFMAEHRMKKLRVYETEAKIKGNWKVEILRSAACTIYDLSFSL
jgi:hypothetical protein